MGWLEYHLTMINIVCFKDLLLMRYFKSDRYSLEIVKLEVPVKIYFVTCLTLLLGQSQVIYFKMKNVLF